MAWTGRFDDFGDVEFDQPKRTKRGSSISKGQGRGYGAHGSSRDEPLFGMQNDNYSGNTTILSLSPNDQNATVVGVVIAREGPRSITSKTGSGNERHLMCLTLSDGPMSFINVTCWGGKEYASLIHSLAGIGSVVEIKGAQVQQKTNPADNKFKPWTPCSCQLSVSETNGCVTPYGGADKMTFARFLHSPTRASNEYYSLDDIQTNGINLQGEHVNILAVVKKVWPVRDITTKTGKKTSKVDVVLCDESCLAFSLTLWDSSVELVERWFPMETVIFGSDVRIVYNDYKSTMAACSNSKSIFTMDPDTPDGRRLSNFAKSQFSFLSEMNTEAQFSEDNRDPDINSITEVWTIQEAKSLVTEIASQDGRAAYGVVYSFLSHLDVDGLEKACLRHVCTKCRKTLLESAGFMCANPSCADGEGPADSQLEYNFTVSFSDHTGTLESCRLQNSVAEQLVGCKVEDFKCYSTQQKTFIKWTYLLEKTKAVVKIKKNSLINKAFVSILALDRVTSQQEL